MKPYPCSHPCGLYIVHPSLQQKPFIHQMLSVPCTLPCNHKPCTHPCSLYHTPCSIKPPPTHVVALTIRASACLSVCLYPYFWIPTYHTACSLPCGAHHVPTRPHEFNPWANSPWSGNTDHLYRRRRGGWAVLFIVREKHCSVRKQWHIPFGKLEV